MARQTTLDIPRATWTEITDADVSAITFQNLSGYHVRIAATAGATPPSNLAGAIRYSPGQGERSTLLADLFPGVTSPARVWVYADDGAVIAVGHD